MAAMFIAKNAILSLSKSLSHNPSLPLRPKVSRVCFTSASKYSEGRNAADDDKKREYSAYDKADEAVGEPGNNIEYKTMDKTKDKTQEMKDKTSDAAEKAKETKDRAAESAHDTKETAKDKAQEMREKSMDTAEQMADKTKEYAKEAKDKTMGAADTIGEKAKQTMQGAWGAAKKAVVGTTSDDDVEDYIEDHVKKPAREGKEKVMDQEVVDERRNRTEDKDQNKY